VKKHVDVVKDEVLQQIEVATFEVIGDTADVERVSVKEVSIKGLALVDLGEREATFQVKGSARVELQISMHDRLSAPYVEYTYLPRVPARQKLRERVEFKAFIAFAFDPSDESKSPGETALVTVTDFETVSRAYRAMLGKLMALVPNTTPERSALGGFSNGAHTVGVLLAGQDKFILDHFTSFYLIEGGFGYSAAAFYPAPLAAFHHCRFLLLYGDQPSEEQSTKIHDYLANAQEISANQHHVSFTRVLMEGVGHDVPPKYQAFLGQWIRGATGKSVQ
jgi:hypothetical protein